MKEEIYLIDYVFMINFKMNQLTLKHATQPVKFQEKKWKNIGYKPSFSKDIATDASTNRMHGQRVKQHEKKLATFLEQIHQVNELAQQLKQSEVVEVESVRDAYHSDNSPIGSLMRVHDDQFDEHMCNCREDLQMMKFQLQKFKEFQKDAQKRSKRANLLMELYLKNTQQPHLARDALKQLHKQFIDPEDKRERIILREENSKMKERLSKMEYHLTKVLEKNSELENKVESCEQKISELKSSVDFLQVRKKNKNGILICDDNRKSHSIQSEGTDKTLSKNEGLGIGVSPKSSATKRFSRTSKKQTEGFITMRQSRNKLKIEKMPFFMAQQKKH